MWPWSRSYDHTPEGAPVVPAGLLEHLIAGAGPHGFSSSSTAEAVAKQHGSSTAGRTVLIVGQCIVCGALLATGRGIDMAKWPHDGPIG